MKLIRLSLILLLLCSTTPLWSDGGLQFKGKLRLLKPTTLQVKDLNGNLILSCPISQNGVFETEKKEISPDVYTLYIGNTEQNIYFENVPVSINGFFDEKNPEQSSLSFTGIDSFLTLQNYMPTEKDPDIATISASVKGKLTPGMAAALAYLANVNDYYSNKMLLDMIPENERTSFVAKWLVNRVEVLSHQIINAECPDFTFIDANGKNVSLKDFRGKIVVLDFCASWCGPCRKEMRSMLTIYNELKADEDRVKGLIEEMASAYEDPKEVIEFYSKNKELMDNMRNVALEEQAVEAVLAKAKVTEKATTFNELMNQQA